MANYERDERAFDGGDDDEDGEGSHLPVVIIIAILVLAAFGGVVWLAYNQGVARGRGEPRVAAAEPSKPGDASGIKVYQQPAAGEEDEGAAKSAPASAPAQTAAAVPQSAPVQAPPQAAPEPVAQAPSPAPQPAPKMVQAAPPPPKAAPVVTPAPAAQVPSAPAVATKPPAQLGLAHPAPVTPAPVTTPPPKAVAAPAKAAPAPAPVKAAAVKPVPAGNYLLQIGAYKSEADALAAWKIYQSKHAVLLNGFGPDVQKADLGDKGIWYRLRIASFADKDAASALCERLKAQNASCFLAH